MGWLLETAPRWLNHVQRTRAVLGELFYEHTLHHHLSFRQRARGMRLERPQWQQQRMLVEGAGLRALRGGAFGYAHTATLTPDALHQTAEQAAKRLPKTNGTLDLLEEVPHVVLTWPDLPEAPNQMGDLEKKAFMQAAADGAWSWGSAVREVRVTWQDRTRRTLVANSNGTRIVQGTLLIGLQVSVTLARDGKRVRGQAIAGSAQGITDLLRHDFEALGWRAAQHADRRALAKPITACDGPVVLGAGWGGVWLHEAIGHLLEADVVAAERSPFALGSGMSLPPFVTLTDDATYAGGRGTYAFDDEGTPAERTVLLADGHVQHFLTDRASAHAKGLRLTGNGRRQDYRFAPQPRMTNLVLAPQPNSPDDMIADVKDGLYVERIGNGIVKPHDDWFSFDVDLGYRIENGRRAHPVTNIQLVGHPSTALKGLRAIANDAALDTGRGICKKQGQAVPISVSIPTVLLDNLHIQPRSTP